MKENRRRMDHCSFQRVLRVSSYGYTAGSYVNYSNIAAKVVRRVLKPELQANAAKRDETHVKFTPWVKGKPSKPGQ
ncbi:hypothetical protein ACI65C_002281 [Semiaphis heraclei]